MHSSCVPGGRKQMVADRSHVVERDQQTGGIIPKVGCKDENKDKLD
jgi:hypothetical protein